MVHNHGTEDGPGLSCREHRRPDGTLRGDCMPLTVDDIVGIWPKDMLGGLSTEEYVRRLRGDDA